MSVEGDQKSCTCKVCREMCYRPCWGTPRDIRKIIAAGYAERLMLYIYDVSFKEDIELLVPALKGGERKTLHTEYFECRCTSCTFQLHNGLCILHDLGLKPKEGKSSWHGGKTRFSRFDIAVLWKKERAQKLVTEWKTNHMIPMHITFEQQAQARKGSSA